jgi:hypothetical protein
MSFRRRTYPEVLDSLLVAITKGAAAESHPFPPPGSGAPPVRHSLQQTPVASVVSVYGSRDGASHLFRKDVDYRLLSDKKTVEWQKGAELPDEGTLLYVNYYPEASLPVVTDVQTGSVVRTLAESAALELAALYAQLEVVYQSGFVDTAEGRALDNVVSLLAMARVRGGRPAGQVVFRRVQGSHGSITIPAGTRVISADGEVEYETTETITLAEGQDTGRVVARDLEANDILPAGSLTVLPKPIAGIEGVTNPSPTAITTQDETDAELRTRAKSFLHGSERATLGAIRQAVTRQGVRAEVVETVEGKCRFVTVTPQSDVWTGELEQRVWQAIEDSRPAGVYVELAGVTTPRKVDLTLRLTPRPDLLDQDRRAAQRAVEARLKDYFARLPTSEAGSLNQLAGLVLGVPEIRDVSFVAASWTHDGQTEAVLDAARGQLTIAGYPTALGKLEVIDASVPTRLSVTVTFPAGSAPADAQAIQKALGSSVESLNLLNAAGAPEPDRTLTFAKLLFTIPVPPGATTGKLADYAGEPARALGEYQVKFVFTRQDGLSQIVSQAGDKYLLAVQELLAVSSVEV